MRRSVWSALALLLVSAPAAAQGGGLRDKISELFVFTPGQQPLFLAGTGVHANHFLTSASTQNGVLISFIGNAVGSNVASIPVSATSGGSTFRFEAGAPVRTSVSPGPIFAERAQTLGKGRVFVGANINRLSFQSLRGVGLHDIRLNFVHENVTGATCDSIEGQSCNPYGVPRLENDVIELKLGLDLDMTVTSFFVSYGLLDRLDIGVALPVVSTSLAGTSDAQIISFAESTAAHFFGGTPSNPILTTSRSVTGSASGIGDVAVRVKVNVSQSDKTGFALLADARFPTGSAEDLLGSGHFSGRALGILSAQFGPFSPHANIGVLLRNTDSLNNAMLVTVGFDHVMAPWATMAADLVSELQIGESKVTLPGPVTYDVPFHRTVDPTNIPNRRDDLINASFGFKFLTGSGIIIVTNALVPINEGGLRPNLMWTAGLEYNF
ncbi:MAG TPA: transporter [Gemmatimonadales bacterium]|nr:transporter [Gemmatimonadales bacterium]